MICNGTVFLRIIYKIRFMVVVFVVLVLLIVFLAYFAASVVKNKAEGHDLGENSSAG